MEASTDLVGNILPAQADESTREWLHIRVAHSILAVKMINTLGLRYNLHRAWGSVGEPVHRELQWEVQGGMPSPRGIGFHGVNRYEFVSRCEVVENVSFRSLATVTQGGYSLTVGIHKMGVGQKHQFELVKNCPVKHK